MNEYRVPRNQQAKNDIPARLTNYRHRGKAMPPMQEGANVTCRQADAKGSALSRVPSNVIGAILHKVNAEIWPIYQDRAKTSARS